VTVSDKQGLIYPEPSGYQYLLINIKILCACKIDVSKDVNSKFIPTSKQSKKGCWGEETLMVVCLILFAVNQSKQLDSWRKYELF
jgi:hypothetical protein